MTKSHASDCALKIILLQPASVLTNEVTPPMRQVKTSPSRRFLAPAAVAACMSVVVSTPAPAACQAYRMLQKFAINQSTGVPVTLSLTTSRTGEVTGSAYYLGGDDLRR